MNPLISVVMPCFNAAPWLADAIESAMAQSYQPIEVIVVDDGSTDESFRIAKSYESRQVKVLQQSQQGPGAARNHGLSHSQGGYIQFLDADDMLDRFKIQRQMVVLLDQPGTIACANWARFTDNIPTGKWEGNQSPLIMEPLEWLLLLTESGYMMPPHGWLTPRCIIDAAGPWKPELRLHDDGDFFCRVVLKAKRIVRVPNAFVYYRSANPHSVSHSAGRAAMESYFKVAMSNCDQVLAYRDAKCARRIAASWLAGFLYASNGRCPDLERSAELRYLSLGERFVPTGGPVLRSMCFALGTLAALRARFWYGSATEWARRRLALAR